MENKNDVIKVIAENKKAYFNFHILDKYETGVALLGPEVKAIRNGSVNFKDSYVDAKGFELFLIDFHIQAAVTFGSYNPDRKRKLLLHKIEITRLISKMNEKSLTLVPLKIYFKNQYVKFEIGLAKGKTNYDKKRSIQEKEMKREVALGKW
jgi:SsrA-binding protein